jgi:hypothetical protein
MTNPTGRPRGRPRKHPRPETDQREETMGTHSQTAHGREETVVLLAPNPSIPYVKDTNNIEFRFGRGEAPRSLAMHYVEVLDGYRIEEGE